MTMAPKYLRNNGLAQTDEEARAEDSEHMTRGPKPRGVLYPVLIRPKDNVMLRIVAVVAISLSIMSAAIAAEIKFQTYPAAEGSDEVSFIEITGKINLGDADRFDVEANKVSTKPHPVYVLLSGPGGNLVDSLHIGTAIRRKGWYTSVPAEKACDSSCAYIWLAGVSRAADVSSRIGFHAVYDMNTKQEMGSGNAILGAYLAIMGVSLPAISYFTSAGAFKMTYLTAEAAETFDIAVVGSLPKGADLARRTSHR